MDEALLDLDLTHDARDYRTLAERAFGVLRQAIVDGKLPPGEHLRITHLAEELEMSPVPVREALQRLGGLGFVERVPHRGTRVAKLTGEDLAEVCQVRLALEPLATSTAARRFGESDCGRASGSFAAFRAAIERDDFPASRVADRDFHFAIYRAADSRWLLAMITPLWETSMRYGSLLATARRDSAVRLAEHERILDACVARDPAGAAAAMRDHLVATSRHLAEAIGAPIELFPGD